MKTCGGDGYKFFSFCSDRVFECGVARRRIEGVDDGSVHGISRGFFFRLFPACML
jgi:hypothetical protein